MLHLTPESEINVGAEVLTISSVRGSNVARRGGKLFNTDTQTTVFDEPVLARVVLDVAWDDLPSVQDWIKYAVLLDQSVTDSGLTQEYQVWEETSNCGASDASRASSIP